MKNVNSKTVCGYISLGRQKHYGVADYSGQGRVRSGPLPTSCHCEVNLIKILLNTHLKGKIPGSPKWMRVLRKVKIVLFRFKIVGSEIVLGEATPCKSCAGQLYRLGVSKVEATNQEGDMVDVDLEHLATHGIVTSGDRKWKTKI
eukprot:TRINITY_DN77654_c0_g1_i1.p1 TRINITY_DN77654_c0_g1~~TRINITY_DN77654_c0_g1_i1.p1  ORF type:complete len:145 (+),score=23.55 TRINITY_DN77654_c0_g1_i1:84-518(+)